MRKLSTDRVILKTPLELMDKQQQEEVWIMSRTKEVYIEDVNGELWRVLDLTTDNDEIKLPLAVRMLQESEDIDVQERGTNP